jgi:ABC-type antimicrobial peptide transport system permease subunit
MGLLVRSSMDTESLAEALRREVQRADADLPLFNIMSLQQIIDERTAGWRVVSALFVVLGGVALFLSCLGIYSVMVFAVGSRRREIGIRMALGARSAGVLRLVARAALLQAVIGLLIGLVAALATTRTLQIFLYEVSPNDPLTLGLVFCLLVATALVACVVPARRASRVDPVIALRTD